MKKILLIVFVLIVGMAFGQVGQDLIILKTGSRSSGDYIETLDDSTIVFKPTDSISKQYINISLVSELKLSDGIYLVGGEYLFGGKPNSEALNKDNLYVIEALNTDNLYVTNVLRPEWNFHNPKDPFKAGLLSLIMPSGGHIYNEEYNKGLFYLFGVPALYIIGDLVLKNNLNKENESGIVAGGIMKISSLFLLFYNSYDAVISAHKINKEYFKIYIKEKNKSKSKID